MHSHSLLSRHRNAFDSGSELCMQKAGQGRAGPGRTGQGRAGQGRAGQGRAGQVLIEQGKA